MPAQLTIPKRSTRPEALDHAALFEAGLESVRELSGELWTDHNLHDPGITTLELLAYALTELSYRASFSVPDLLAVPGNDQSAMQQGFFTARRILTNRALTSADYRKLLIDLEGVKNAWVWAASETYYADRVHGELQREAPADMTGFARVDLRGLYDVRLEFMEGVTPSEQPAIVEAARRTLHANRNLCEDFVGISAVERQQYVLCAELDIEADADVETVHAELLFRAQQYLSPPLAQHSLAEMLARTHDDGTPYTVEEIFDGPALHHGFIDDAELKAADLREEIRLSDLIALAMEVPGVKAVREMTISPAGASSGAENRWSIPVPALTQAMLDSDSSRLVMYKRNMPFVAKPELWRPIWNQLGELARVAVETERDEDLEVPTGRFRRLAGYSSVQNDFPAIYGLRVQRAAETPDDREHRLVDQLRGYLLFFDQLMADLSAQLAHTADLFSLDGALLSADFHQRVDSFVDAGRIYGPADVPGAIAQQVDDPALRIDRRNRFLDHLIARYAEHFSEFAAIMRTTFAAPPVSMIGFKCDFLREYPALSSERSLAYDYSLRGDAELWNSENVSGLERRLARLLGMPRPTRRNLGEVAYDVYAEVDVSPVDEFRFRVRDRRTGKIVLSSSTKYVERDAAVAEMRRAIAFALLPSGYQRKQASDGSWYFNVVDDTGEVLARRIEYFHSQETMEAAIVALMDYLRANYSEEGMYLIEHILLRPQGSDTRFLPICADQSCAGCADEDPYSYRLHVVLPAFAGRFNDMRFRGWAEQVIRQEMPAHIEPCICWISTEDMAAFEKAYRDWIYLCSGRETAQRAEKLDAFITLLSQLRNVYPVQPLHECDADEKFILGATALGTKKS